MARWRARFNASFEVLLDDFEEHLFRCQPAVSRRGMWSGSKWKSAPALTYRLDRNKLRQARGRDSRCARAPISTMRRTCGPMQLVAVEEA
jgi:hypothetical protein